jgi:peptidoglycan hydrolase-like protein with peptidoglycan-binding domain
MLEAAQLATKDMQAELARFGYYNGPIDGVPRPETTNAIRSFQADEGLPVTGQVDPSLISALLSRSNAK